MGEIIRGWILQQLGLACRGHAWDEDQDGELIAHLLHSYSLLSGDQLAIVLDAAHPLHAATIDVMRQTIRQLGIELAEAGFQDVLAGRARATTKLLYELYLALNDPSSLGVLLPPRLKEPVTTSRFAVASAELVEPARVEKFSNPLSAPLDAKDDVVAYHLDKYRQLTAQCERARQDYVQFVEARSEEKKPDLVAGSSFNVRDLPDDAQSVDESIGELLREEKRARDAPRLQPDRKVAAEIIRGMKTRAARAQRHREARTSCGRAVLIDTWQRLLQEQEAYFKQQFVQLLQQQSGYERQLAACLLATRHHADAIVEEKRALMAHVASEQEARAEAALTDALAHQDAARTEYYLELQRKQTLHRQLFEMRAQRRREQTRSECASIVSDLLDMAHYTCDYHEVHHAPVARRDRDKLVKRFIAGEPILSDLQLDLDAESEASLLEDVDQQAGPMDELALEDYLQFNWPWLEDDRQQEMTLGLNVLGHLVHRLLADKYPEEPLRCAAPLPKTAVAACVTGFTDLSLLPGLVELLRPLQVHVFQLTDAFEHCIEACRAQQPEETEASSADMSQSQWDSASEVTATTRTDAPCDLPATLGRQVLEMLQLGQNPDAALKARTVVEYLRHVAGEGARGWLLLNYPQTYLQAVALEEALSCMRVPSAPPTLDEDVIAELDGERTTTTATATASASTLAARRRSRLLENPRTRDDDAAAVDYRSPLSAFVQLVAAAHDNVDANIAECFTSSSNAALLGQFYRRQGCAHTLSYDALDAAAVHQLAHLVAPAADPPSTTRSGASDKATQVPTPQPGSASEVHVDEEAGTAEVEEEPRPGEYRWRYHDLPMAGELSGALATLWERVEAAYVAGVLQLCLRRRVLLDSLLPYNACVQRHLLAFIARPDDKQTHLHAFQAAYNAFDDDMREDDEVKAELHQRVDEFREKLWKLCDARMMASEEERVRVIHENWFTVLLVELANAFVSLAQVELDRSTDTSQLIADYYTALLATTSASEPPLPKLTLQLIQLPGTVEDMFHLAPFVEFVEEALQRSDGVDADADASPFARRVASVTRAAAAKAHANHAFCAKVLADLGRRAASPEASGVLREMEATARGELARVELRLRLIERVLAEEAHDVLAQGAATFHRLYDAICVRYRRECVAVAECARLLKRAVEEEVRVQPEMLLVDDMFYVHLGALTFAPPLPDAPDAEAAPAAVDGYFSVPQLARIADVLHRLAPSGVIGERAFAFLLQEFVAYEEDSGAADLVPALWRALEPHKTHALMRRLFGDAEYVDWRDFVVYCLHVRMPDEAEVLRVRRDFRALDPDASDLVPGHLLAGVPLWFGGEALVRDLLLQLFAADGQLNYVALLLAFCKDADPVMGFAKALAVALGRPVCYDEARGSVEYARALKSVMQRDLLAIVRQIEAKDTRLDSAEQHVGRLIEETLSARVDLQALEDDEPTGPLCADDLVDYLARPPADRITTSSVAADLSDLLSDAASSAGSEEATPTSQRSLAASPPADGLAYVIGFDVIMNVLTVTLPWIHQIKRCGELTFHERFALIYNSLINADVPAAFIYQILMHADFARLLLDVYKFYDRDPVQIVRELVHADDL